MTKSKAASITAKAILWDMDGTLVDTASAHYYTWQQILKQFGVTLTWEMFKPSFGAKNEDFLGEWLPGAHSEVEIQQLGVKKEAAFRKNLAGRLQVFPGVREWLVRFRDWGLFQAVASSAPPENISAMLAETGLAALLEVSVSSAGLPGKPDPAIFLQAAGLLEVAPEECLVIEDSVIGVQAARQAGMKCVAVTNTFPREALSVADLVVAGLDHLEEAEAKKLLRRE